MAEIKWIKITTNMFEDEKINFIESLPDSDTILIVWIKLLALAGKINAKGYIFLTENIPYTEEMLAHKFRRSLNTVRLALETFQKLGMIETDGNGIYISNWEKHQNVDGMEKVRKLTNERVKRHREKQKQILLEEGDVSCNVTVTQSNAIDIDKDIDKEKHYQQLVDLYHEICISYPKVLKITPIRKKHINARLKDYTLDDYKQIFLKAESSDFMKGKNDNGWKANFDWLLNENNVAKVLEGKYDNKTRAPIEQSKDKKELMYEILMKQAEGG